MKIQKDVKRPLTNQHRGANRRRVKAHVYKHPPPLPPLKYNDSRGAFTMFHPPPVERNTAILWTKVYTDSLIMNKPPPFDCQFDIPDKKQKSKRKYVGTKFRRCTN